jgi:ribonuclease HII
MRRERELAEQYPLIAGVDEAGRGPLAGPLVAAACILPCQSIIKKFDDSKKLTLVERGKLFKRVTTHCQVVYAVGIVDAKTIDEINIHQATLLAMKRAVENLSARPDYLLVDGMFVPDAGIPGEAIKQGDTTSIPIMAAAIIAKVLRDRMMIEYDKQWPEFGFANHKGYGTKEHIRALEQYGPCPIHRMSFEPLKPKVPC